MSDYKFHKTTQNKLKNHSLVARVNKEFRGFRNALITALDPVF